MSNELPLTISMGALPPNQAWTPQELADAIAARLRIETQQALALFVAGSTAPTSDSGPWWKDNQTLYRWNPGTGTYVPQVLEPSSIGRWIGETAPDPAVYSVWIQTDSALQPLSLRTYYSGSWVDVYAATIGDYLTISAFNAAMTAYSTTSQMNSAIAAAAVNYEAQGTNTAPQSIDADGVAVKIDVSDAPINPAPAPMDVALDRYVAAVAGNYIVAVSSQFDNVDASAAGVEVLLGLYKNGADAGMGDSDGTPSPNGLRWSPAFTTMIRLAANDYLELFVEVSDGVGTGSIELTTFRFSVWRVGD
jgi:hypothetical protein